MAGSFRFVTELTGHDADGGVAAWSPSGEEFGPLSAAPLPSKVPGTLVIEAMSQCAGLFLQLTHEVPGTAWMLTGVDDADVDHAEIAWGAEVTLLCAVHKRSARAAVLAVSAESHQGEVGHATILMHRIVG